MSKQNPHYKILSALYEISKEHENDDELLKKIAAISWTLEFELGFDTYGYFELAEEIMYGHIDHYTDVIEKSLIDLRSKAK